MNTQTYTPEQLNSIECWANRYDLTALLDAVMFTYSPDVLRRDLLQSYFYIASRETSTENEDRTEVSDPLFALQTLIEALDNTPEQPGPLRVVAADEAPAKTPEGLECPGRVVSYEAPYDAKEINDLRAEIIEARRAARHARIEAGYWADSLSDLQMRAQLSEAEQEKYRAFRIRIGAAADKKKAEVDKLTADNLEQLERESQSTEAELWREIYRDLYQRTAEQLTPEQQRAHQEMKERIELHTKHVAVMPTSHPGY